MTKNFDKELRDVFEIDALKRPLFYNWPISIRYELSGGDSYIEMFMRAMERSKALFSFAFKDSDQIHVHISFWKEKRSYNAKPYLELEKCGFSLPKEHARKITKVSDDEVYDSGYKYHYVFKAEVHDTNIQGILWAVMSNELDIQPTTKITAYFVDFEQKLIFHPYDDRGLDIVAIDKDTIIPLYKEFYDWILDYDLEEVKRKLGIKNDQ